MDARWARRKRGHSDYLAAARVLQALSAGQAVVIFPQGAVRGDCRWKQGAAHAALMTGAPLVLVRLVGTARDPDDSAAAAELTERLRVAIEALA